MGNTADRAQRQAQRDADRAQRQADRDADRAQRQADRDRRHGDHSDEAPEYRLPESGVNYQAVAHAELVRAVMRGRPQHVRAVGDGWQRLGSSLNERSAELADRAEVLAQRWSGTAFDAYRLMILDLVESAREVASTALELRDYAHADADLLERAQKALVGLGVPTDGEVAVSGTWGSATVTGAGQGSTVNVVVNRGVPG